MASFADSPGPVTFDASALAAGSDANASAVTWPAVLAGAAVSAALALILLALGAGLGLETITPWSNVGLSAASLGTAAVVWMLLMQAMSSAFGGYLAGRLRTQWVRVHTDEVYFRDTAHGFLAWAISVIVTASLLVGAATTLAGGAVPKSGAAATPATSGGANTYFVDALFRSDHPTQDRDDLPMRAEAGRILTVGIAAGALAPDDENYLGQLVAASTGLPPDAALQRVGLVFNRARADADTVRKTLAHGLLWIFIALLLGAFCASFAATIGGRQRDHLPLAV